MPRLYHSGKAACQRLGWDLSRGAIARIEAGDRWVGDFELLELARVFGVPVADLYPEKDRHYFR